MTGAQPRVAFNQPLALPQGRHEIDVQAGNLMGAQAGQTLVVHVDRQGPLITVEAIGVDPHGAGATLRLSGSVFDDGGIAALSVDDQPVSVARQTEVAFSQTVAAGHTRVAITAVDRVGQPESGPR